MRERLQELRPAGMPELRPVVGERRVDREPGRVDDVLRLVRVHRADRVDDRALAGGARSGAERRSSSWSSSGSARGAGAGGEGSIVYSVCTMNADESEDVVDASGLTVDATLADEWPQFRHLRRPEFLQTLPHRDGTAGFFVARLRR